MSGQKRLHRYILIIRAQMTRCVAPEELGKASFHIIPVSLLKGFSIISGVCHVGESGVICAHPGQLGVYEPLQRHLGAEISLASQLLLYLSWICRTWYAIP